MDPRDRVDIRGQPLHPARQPGEPSVGGANGPRRAFLQIWFRCCHTYGRLTKSTDGMRYAGRCPRCGARCEVAVGPGGTNRRAFEAW